jgi:hypothetical protein
VAGVAQLARTGKTGDPGTDDGNRRSTRRRYDDERTTATRQETT